MGKILVIEGADYSSVAVGKVTPVSGGIVITVVASPLGGGTVSGTGSYEEGEQVQIKAFAADGYTFKRWNDGDTNAIRTITVGNSAQTYTAVFETPSTTWYNDMPTGVGQGWNTNGFPCAVGLEASLAGVVGKDINIIRIGFRSSTYGCTYAKNNMYITKLSVNDIITEGVALSNAISSEIIITDEDIARGYKEILLNSTYNFISGDIIALAVNTANPETVTGNNGFSGLFMDYANNSKSYRFKNGQAGVQVSYGSCMIFGLNS